MKNDPKEETEIKKKRPKFVRKKRTWRAKIHDSLCGFRQSIREQSSYRVHFFFAVLVLALGFFLKINLIQWSMILFAITAVITTEMINTAIEKIAREITDEESPFIEQGLNIASGAVLMVSLGSAFVGSLIFGSAFLDLIHSVH